MRYKIERLQSQQDVTELNAMVNAAISDLEKDPLIGIYIDFSDVSYPKDKDSVFVARHASDIVGALKYHMHSTSGTIDILYVHPKHRRRKIGRRLVKEVEKDSIRRGKKKVIVYTVDGSENFFTDRGYYLVYHSAAEDRMAKKLGSLS